MSDGPIRHGLGYDAIDLDVIGKPRARVDGLVRSTGRLVYADDLRFPGTLHTKLLRSPHPHARIVAIDTAAALGSAGVRLVLTGADTPERFGILPVSQDETALAVDKARFAGDPIAAVIADDEDAAERGVALLRVEWEVLPEIRDPAAALATADSPLHGPPGGDNVHKVAAFEFGEVDAAMTCAAHRFDGDYFYGGNGHLALEQHASVAVPEPDGRITLYSSTQVPHYVHKVLEKTLGLTADRIRVVATPNGGGFGGKSDVFGHEVVVCKASMLLGKPVRIALTREEVYHCHRGRHPVAMRLSTGVDADGRIASVDLQTVLDGGAYGSYGVASTYYTGALQTVTYRVPAYRWRGLRAFTNKAPCGPKRGHGTVQPRFAQEVQLDEIAASLGKDPAELRLAMIEASGGVTANWLRLPTVGLAECIRQVVARSGFATRRGHGRGGRGLGLACSSYLSGAGLPIHWSKLPHSAVQLRIDRSGLVVAYCGATEIGQGSDDVLAACVAEELGLEPKAIRLVTGDTDLTPVDLGSYSSRVTLMMGNAAVSAARKAAAALREAAAAKLGVDPAIIVLRAGKLWAGDSSMPFRQAAHLAEEQRGALAFTGSYRAPTPAARWKGGGVGPSPTYSYTAAVVEVDVDEATGFVRPERVWIAHDLGRPINKTLAEGQVIGSVYMGLGEALLEEQEHRGNRPSGTPGFIVRAPSLLDNKSLLHPDMPPVDVVLCGEPDPEGPYGAKEVGQGPLAPVVPALVNAVWDAVSVRSHRVPLTPDLLLRALDDKARGKPAIVPADPLPAVPWPPPLRVRTPWEGGDGTADEMGDYEPGRGHRTDV